MPRRRISHEAGLDAIESYLESGDSKSPEFTTAVRYLLEELAEVAPGNSVEVRVPPLGATQCIEGPRHTRGTPPNVVEMSPEVWFELALGKATWDEVLAKHLVTANGVRATLDEVLPLKIKGLIMFDERSLQELVHREATTMPQYPKPPFDTTDTWISDSFDPELGSDISVIDLNEFSTDELLSIGNELAMKIVAWRLENPPEASFDQILDYFIFVNPMTHKVEDLYLHFHEPQKRINGEWVPVDRLTDPDIERHLESSLMYKAYWELLFSELPELDDEDEDLEVRTAIDLAFDAGTLTEAQVQKYSKLLTDSEGNNPEPNGF